MYTIAFKDTLKPVTAADKAAIFKRYGDNHLYGWKSPKPLYAKIGHARNARAQMPKKLRDMVGIYKLQVVPGDLSEQNESTQ